MKKAPPGRYWLPTSVKGKNQPPRPVLRLHIRRPAGAMHRTNLAPCRHPTSAWRSLVNYGPRRLPPRWLWLSRCASPNASSRTPCAGDMLLVLPVPTHLLRVLDDPAESCAVIGEAPAGDIQPYVRRPLRDAGRFNIRHGRALRPGPAALPRLPSHQSLATACERRPDRRTSSAQVARGWLAGWGEDSG